MNTEEMLSQRENINKAFKLLIKSGRPDIRDEHNNDLVKALYVDLQAESKLKEKKEFFQYT